MTVLLPVKDLFGGAIRMGVPPQWTDLSDLRQVPDNQEAFADTQSDQSFILEVVEELPQQEVLAAAAVAWQDAAAANQAAPASSPPALQQLGPADYPGLSGLCSSGGLVSGVQVVPQPQTQGGASSSGSSSGYHEVAMHMALLRLPSVHSEVLLTLHVPLKEGDGVDGSASQKGLQLLKQMLLSLQVVDAGLFG